jgi:hypothetical protein
MSGVCVLRSQSKFSLLIGQHFKQPFRQLCCISRLYGETMNSILDSFWDCDETRVVIIGLPNATGCL